MELISIPIQANLAFHYTRIALFKYNESLYTPFVDEANLEMISGIKFHHDDSLISFKRLFDIQTWSILFLVLITSTFMMRKISESLWSFKFILMSLIELFTSQSSQFNDSKIFRLPFSLFTKINLIILVCILLQSASILTKAFTGLLLTTYANVLYIPCVNSFEQIYQDQSLEVQSHLIRIPLDYIKSKLDVNPDIIKNIVEREKIF